MSVSLEEQRFSRVYGDGEPDFIELPTKPTADRPLRRLRRPQPARQDSNQPAGGAKDQASTGLPIRVDPQHAASHRPYRRPEPNWKRILVGLLTFERSTGYAISITVHVFLIIILALFVVGGSAPTPRIKIVSTFAEQSQPVGELLDMQLSQPIPDVAVNRIPMIGDVESADGAGLGRFFGDGGAEFFGLRAGGRDFVYIVDCSGSMEGAPFARACRELLDSIDELKSDQRFYVMFFSTTPFLMFNESGPPRGLIQATPDNKRRLREWVERLDADGDTKPVQALKWGIGLDPDAVFVLTDGEFRESVDGITELNDGTAHIHTVAFMSDEGEDVLRRMADENGGTYRFVP